jgi:Lhr-like helicase
MVVAVNMAENGLTTVVIVPLVALLDDLLSCLQAKKISASVWSDSKTSYNLWIILVMVEKAAGEQFFTYFLHGCQLGKIMRAVLDQIHMMLTTLHYHPLCMFLSRLRQASIQFIGSSATILPISMIEKLIMLAQFTPSTTKLIRAPTFCPEIVYSSFELQQHPRPSTGQIGYIDHGGNDHSLLNYIQDIVTNFQSEERALVFCLTKNEAKEIAKLLGCEFYHAGLPVIERQDVGTRWQSGRYKLLVTTSAFGAGIDYSKVKLVIHYRRPRNIINYSQESG